MKGVFNTHIIPNTRFLVYEVDTCILTEEQPRELIVVIHKTGKFELLPLMQNFIQDVDIEFNIKELRQKYRLDDSLTIGKYNCFMNDYLDTVNEVEIKVLGEEWFKNNHMDMLCKTLKRLPDIFIDKSVKELLGL